MKDKPALTIGGGLKYCPFTDCLNTVHREDSPTHYPCCDKHKRANKAYWEMKEESQYHESITQELFNIKLKP